eukprot:gnl/TRDRNA2_/TRDRNA2_176137_c0_seq8.p1 gnl/TRDRNA2_/TRDRNA2_176137_c0~~gnl/TRDRNA2_/TRDRNA2_176137_c0_seq8.p1  ORF type:complete len:536 (-),score=95.38 gnl/TRDRNA2_/TRDRNA2_176137_c0_seq8:302-1909(-)
MAVLMATILALGCTLYVAHGASHASKLKLAQDIDYPPYASIDETGELTGFGADIARGMNGMCDELDIEVVQVKWSDCWTPEGLGAKLEDGSVDACMTYTHTKGLRPKFADFSNGILSVNKAAGLLVLLDENGQPKITGLSDLSGKKVVDVGGWAPTADGLDFVENKCTGKKYASDYILMQATDAKNNNDLALDMLLSGEADAMFVYADQAYNYKKVCKTNPDQAWTCDNWEQFGKKFAYVQTGQFGYVNNGTTLALTKKGSGVAEKLNPCLQKFMATKDYYDICVKYDFVDTCYPNEFFPGADEIVVHDYNKPTNEHVGDCTDGYCSCPEGSAPASSESDAAPALEVCCPCLGALPDVIKKVECDKPYKDASGHCVAATVQGKTAHYPTSYGAKCGSHMEPGHTDCYNVEAGKEKHADAKADWCDDAWCYVDPCNCNAPNQYKSNYFEGSVTYTYSACTKKAIGSDNIDRYSGTVDGSKRTPPETDGCSASECGIDATPAATPEPATTSEAASGRDSAKGLMAVLLSSYCLFNAL